MTGTAVVTGASGGFGRAVAERPVEALFGAAEQTFGGVDLPVGALPRSR